MYDKYMDGGTLGLAALTLLSWGVGSFVAKLATNRIGDQAVFWDLVGYAPVITLYCLVAFKAANLWVGDKGGVALALLAGVIGSLGMVCFYMLLTRKDASVAVPLTALFPALTAILAVIFLREQLTAIKVAGITLSALALYMLSL